VNDAERGDAEGANDSACDNAAHAITRRRARSHADGGVTVSVAREPRPNSETR
jgi:hypothetical protein